MCVRPFNYLFLCDNHVAATRGLMNSDIGEFILFCRQLQTQQRVKWLWVTKCLPHVKNFKYFGCEFSYENGKDIPQNIAKFPQIRGILNSTFKPNLAQDCSRIKVYNHWVSPFFYMKAKFGPSEKRIKVIVISWDEIFQKNSWCTLFDHSRNEEIFEDLKGEPIEEKLRRCKSDWLRHITRMNSSKMAKMVMNCRPNGRRRLGRSLKRQLQEAETGL